MKLMDNILALHSELLQKSYKHGEYKKFHICDPKQRVIHKALVRDRLLHHAIYRILYPFYDKLFFADSFSCRLDKGTHKAITRFKKFFYKVSQNNTKTCWVLKCDVRKFFDSMDHSILFSILKQKISNPNTLWLLSEIVQSFNKDSIQLELFDLRSANRERERKRTASYGRGIPIGNLTSQLFANIYLNEFDKYIKHRLKIRYYIRFADDFVIFDNDCKFLRRLLPKIEKFLHHKLKLKIHQQKLLIKTVVSGLDFLGWVHFPDHRTLRTTSKRRMLRRITVNQSEETINSYLGLLEHGNTTKIRKKFEKILEQFSKSR